MSSKHKKSILIGHGVDGRPIRKYFYGATQKECQKKIDAYKLSIATGHNPDAKPETFAAWADNWLSSYKEGQVAEATYSMYALAVKHLKEYFGNAPIRSIRQIEVQDFFKLNKNVSNSMVNKLRITANAIFKSAVVNQLIMVNPMDGMPRPKGNPAEKKHIWTAEQSETAFQFAIWHPYGLGAALIIKTGMRRGEIMGIIPQQDIDIEAGLLYVRRSITDVNGVVSVRDGGKSKSAVRAIPLDSECINWIKREPAFKKDGFLFRTKRRKKILSPRQWYKIYYTPFMDALTKRHPEIPRLSPHELRHTYGTLLYQSGTDLYTLQHIMGHANISTTSKYYVHSDNETLKEKIFFPNTSKMGSEKEPHKVPTDKAHSATIININDFRKFDKKIVKTSE